MLQDLEHAFSTATAPQPETTITDETTKPRRTPPRRWLSPAFLTLLLLGSFGGAGYWRWSHAPASPAAQPAPPTTAQPSASLQPTGLRVLVSVTNEAPQPPPPFRAEPRVALVIGNSNYREGPLPNPANDAQDMTAALQSVGFAVVGGVNRTRAEMLTDIDAFGEKLRRGGVGLFYFAGHGMQVKGLNYLIPVDANIRKELDIEINAIKADSILNEMEAAHNRLNIVILDACRNNPFARSFRSGANGLASQNAPTGTLIAYATQPGNVASDGTRRNGLYTQELLVALRTPGRKVEDVFKQVREQVLQKSGNSQTPWEHSSLVGDFDFLPSSNAGVVEVKPALLPLPAPTVPATAPTSTPTQNPTQSGQKTFPFLASSGWVESGITVQPGQQVKITITYSGVNLGKFGPTGPAGVLQQDENRPLKSCPTGAPLARVGAGNAPPICLANTPTFTAQQAGKLFFGLNESNYKDNAGTVIAKIELVP